MASCANVSRVVSRNVNSLRAMSTHTVGTKISVSVMDRNFIKALGGSIRRKGISVRALGATYHHVLRTGCGLKLFSGPCGCYSPGHPTHSVFAGTRHSTTHEVTTRDFILLGGSDPSNGPGKGPLLPFGPGKGVTIVNPLTGDQDGVPNA